MQEAVVSVDAAGEDKLFVIREARHEDVPFIGDSWATDYSNAPAVFGMDRREYRRAMGPYIRRLLGREGSEALIACSANDPDTILGWAVVEGETLHYAYVRRDVRRCGIFSALIAGRGINKFSHRPRRWSPPKGWHHLPTWLEVE